MTTVWNNKVQLITPIWQKVIRSAFARWYNKNRDSKQSLCQSGLPIILLCFTQNSTCDSWKGFTGQLSAQAPDNTHTMSRHIPVRGRRQRDKDVREGSDPCWTVLWTKLCARRFRLYLPSHPPSLRVCGGRSSLRAGRLPLAEMDDGKPRRFPKFPRCSRGAGSEIIGQRGSGDGSELWTTERRECRYVCLCRWVCMWARECVWMFLRSWHQDCESVARLPPYVHPSLSGLTSIQH